MEKYEVFHCTALGYSHVKRGTCCEDFSGSVQRENCCIAAVSDGHGDPSCFRSQVGSQRAVEIACEQLAQFADDVAGEQWEGDLLSQEEQERLVRQLIRSVMGNWTIQVLKDLEENPVQEDELAVSGSYQAAYRQGNDLPHIYGCTLIAALVTPGYLLVIHQGDGRCVMIHEDGTVDQPVPWDEYCVGNVCTSLCQDNAVERCRFYLVDLKKDQIAGCFVVSDGVEDSLESLSDLNAFICHMASLYAQMEAEEFQTELEKFLPQMSENGSADDMSMAGICHREALQRMAERLQLTYELSDWQARERAACTKLSSMERKGEYLQERIDQAEQEYRQACMELEQGEGLLVQIKREWERLSSLQDNKNKVVEQAQQEVEKRRKEYQEYCQRRSQFEINQREAAQQVTRIREKLMRLEVAATAPKADWELEEME